MSDILQGSAWRSPVRTQDEEEPWSYGLAMCAIKHDYGAGAANYPAPPTTTYHRHRCSSLHDYAYAWALSFSVVAPCGTAATQRINDLGSFHATRRQCPDADPKPSGKPPHHPCTLPPPPDPSGAAPACSPPPPPVCTLDRSASDTPSAWPAAIAPRRTGAPRGVSGARAPDRRPRHRCRLLLGAPHDVQSTVSRMKPTTWRPTAGCARAGTGGQPSGARAAERRPSNPRAKQRPRPRNHSWANGAHEARFGHHHGWCPPWGRRMPCKP